jgi:protein-S-isoprenylcysteine O-methyltransferase Ste14
MSDTMRGGKMPASAYVQAPIFLILAAVALFVSAGSLAIAPFWIYLTMLGAVFIASFLWIDPDLAHERMRPGGQKPPRALWLFSGALFVHWIIAGLDRGRLHWTDTVPGWIEAIGLIAVAAGWGLCFWAMHVNRFFSSVVRIQTDRGQHVISRGPYAIIRHPGYLAGVVIIAASGVALGSWLATAFLIVCSLPFLLYRAVVEDRVLQAELPGYRDYAGRVHWRLVPGIW